MLSYHETPGKSDMWPEGRSRLPGFACAPLDVGALAPPPGGFQPSGLDELVGYGSAREIVQRLSAELLPKKQRREKHGGAVACRRGTSTLAWASVVRDTGKSCALHSSTV